MAVICAKGLTKYYGKARGILDLDLTVEQGECFGFIGPNGAGKSTTIRTLLGLIAPTSGSATVLGLDILRDRQAIARRVGYLPAEAAFYPGMKVRELLEFSAGLRGLDCREEAKKLCARMELDPDKKVEALSFGNRKKAAILCALQHKPELLILDEPTGGLDPLMQKVFFEIIEERIASGATVFLSSHILGEIRRHCGRAAVIREGRIIACGPVAQLGQTDAKRITLRGTVDLSGLEVRDLQRAGETTSFLYGGDINALLAALARGSIRDLTVAEPDLDEIFLHYYQEGGVQA